MMKQSTVQKKSNSAYSLKRQQGLSMWGFLFGGAFVCGAALVFMKLFPLYMEQHQVDAALAGLTAQPGWGAKPNRAIRSKIGKFLNINQVDTVEEQHIKIKREDGQTIVTIKYERREPLFHVLDVVAKYDKSVYLKSDQ